MSKTKLKLNAYTFSGDAKIKVKVSQFNDKYNVCELEITTTIGYWRLSRKMNGVEIDYLDYNQRTPTKQFNWYIPVDSFNEVDDYTLDLTELPMPEPDLSPTLENFPHIP